MREIEAMAFFQVTHVTKHFGGLTAVHDVSFRLGEKEIVGLIGPNGAGKTTLFNLIAGAFRCSEGKIEFNGRQIQQLKSYQICRLGIARTFQIVRPFAEMSCLENVLVAFIGNGRYSGNPSRRRNEAAQLLEFVGLGQLIEQPAGNLNLINKKRLEIARALATQPSLILLDEVLGGLNSGEISEALSLIHSIRNEWGVTILWIEHVMGALMKVVERVLVLDNGRLICEGPPDQVVADQCVIEAYLGESDD